MHMSLITLEESGTAHIMTTHWFQSESEENQWSSDVENITKSKPKKVTKLNKVKKMK